MKNLLPLSILVFTLLVGCTKDELKTQTTQDVQSSLTSRTTDFRNPDPTWIQVTYPILRPAKWGGYVFAGFNPGVPGPYSEPKFQIYDTTFIMKWHLHVGLRHTQGGKWKPDVIDSRYYNINAINQDIKSLPNGGVMGDYDFVDTIRIPTNRWGYYNFYYTPQMGYDASYQLYDYNGVSPEIHSSATNGFLYESMMSKFLK
jgi:hypothetical protein